VPRRDDVQRAAIRAPGEAVLHEAPVVDRPLPPARQLAYDDPRVAGLQIPHLRQQAHDLLSIAPGEGPRRIGARPLECPAPGEPQVRDTVARWREDEADSCDPLARRLLVPAVDRDDMSNRRAALVGLIREPPAVRAEAHRASIRR